MLGCLLQWDSPNDFNAEEFAPTYVLVFVFVVDFEVWILECDKKHDFFFSRFGNAHSS